MSLALATGFGAGNSAEAQTKPPERASQTLAAQAQAGSYHVPEAFAFHRNLSLRAQAAVVAAGEDLANYRIHDPDKITTSMQDTCEADTAQHFTAKVRGRTVNIRATMSDAQQLRSFVTPYTNTGKRIDGLMNEADCDIVISRISTQQFYR